MQQSKAQLSHLLQNKDNKVLALSGKWGTGKTHLLREVRDASTDQAVKKALYISLFGLSNMNQVKLKIVQDALPNAQKEPAMWRKVTDGVRATKKVLISIHGAFSALDELALLAAPSILKGKVIVLDDIERKHSSLSIDEILGFIDEFTQLHGARFVLVLNTDQLDNRDVWDVLREKVVDQEIRLETSPAEAFSIAIGLTPSHYAEVISDSAERCCVTNIRVIRKIIRAVNHMLGDRHDLSAAVLARVVPSIVLLAAINYRGIHDGPDFEYVLRAGRYLDEPDEDVSDSVSEKKRKKGWELLLIELGIVSSDEFELLVVEFMQSGLFDATAVSAVIDRYMAENDSMVARSEVNAFQERIIWDHRCTDHELLAEAKRIRPTVHLLDAFHVTSLATQISDLAGGEPIADDLVGEWLVNFDPKDTDPDDDFPYRRPVHPRIKEALAACATKAQASTSVVDAAMHIMMHSGWGTRQELAMKSATISDFEDAIRTLEMPLFRRFMRKMLDLSLHRDTNRNHFGSAVDNFAAACRSIVRDTTVPRLARLIEGLFVSANLEELLTQDEAKAPSEQTAAAD